MPDKKLSRLLAASAEISGPDTERGVTLAQLARDIERLRTMHFPASSAPTRDAETAKKTELDPD